MNHQGRASRDAHPAASSRPYTQHPARDIFSEMKEQVVSDCTAIVRMLSAS